MPVQLPRALAHGIDGPEAVAWDPRGALFAGSQDGILYRLELATGVLSAHARLGGRVLGILVADDGSVLACNQDLRRVQRVSVAGEVSTLVTGTGEHPMTTPNSIAAGRDGTLYVSDSGTWGNDDGGIYSWRAGQGARLEEWESRAYPNGLAVVGDWLYVVESRLPGVARFELETGRREIVWTAPHGSVPDGIAACADGSLVVAFYDPDLVVHLVDGRATELARQGLLRSPTNVAFFGERLERLCAANLRGELLVELPTTLTGAPVASPALSGVTA